MNMKIMMKLYALCPQYKISRKPAQCEPRCCLLHKATETEFPLNTSLPTARGIQPALQTDI